MYSVLNTLSEYTCLKKKKNITSYTFLLVLKSSLKSSKAFSVSLKQEYGTRRSMQRNILFLIIINITVLNLIKPFVAPVE